MNIFEIYLLLVLFFMVTWPLLAIYQYKKGNGVKGFDKAASDFKQLHCEICASVGVPIGSFLVALIVIPVAFVWILSLPIVVVIKLFRKC